MKLWPLFAILPLAAHASAQAFSCAPTEGQECRLELSSVTIVLPSGIYNFDGDSQLIGGDGYVYGYTVGGGQFPDLTPIDTSGRAGFSFVPPMYGAVGGSGIEGYHEAIATFTFSSMQFVAKPGYRVDGVELSVSGTRTTAGNGSVSLLVPGVPVFSGDEFTGTAMLDPFSAQTFSGGFSATAYYEEGPGGTAASYGTASAALTAASLVVHTSAVPEPATALLWLLGASWMVAQACSTGASCKRG
jgi:hypothetical protein